MYNLIIVQNFHYCRYHQLPDAQQNLSSPSRQAYIPRQAYTFGGNPHVKDIFVEVDWMEGHEMSEEAQVMVIKAFARHNIRLWIDDGWMGGGEEVAPHTNTISYQDSNGDFNDYGDYFDAFFSTGRQGIFHYCLMANYVTSDGGGVGGVSNGPYPGHFTVADGVWCDIEAGSTFMHELGHTLHLTQQVFIGIDEDPNQPGSGEGIYSFSEYPSCMNYNAPRDFYGYSDGSHGVHDFDDWGNLELGWRL